MKNFAQVAEQTLESSNADLESFLNEKWKFDNSKTVKDELSSEISVTGENLAIRKFEKPESPNGLVFDYIHAGGKIGVLVAVESNVVNDDIKEMTKHIAMQVASMKPKYVTESEIDEDYKNKEREILLEKAKNDQRMQESLKTSYKKLYKVASINN